MIRFGHNGAGYGRQAGPIGLLFYPRPATAVHEDGA